MLCAMISCSGYSRTGKGAQSGLSFRAFVSNPVSPNLAGGGSPVLNIVDATRDTIPGYVVSLSSLGFNMADAGMMSVSPNHDRTLVMSPADFKLGVVDNVKESLVGTFTLPGVSESFFVWTDNDSVFVAIPSAPITGQNPGAVERLTSSSGSVTATIPIAGAHYLVPSPDGSKILVFADNSDTITLITPSLIGTNPPQTSISTCNSTQVAVCTLEATFDHPIGAVFDSSGGTAYVLNCGPECGGTAAGVAVVNMQAISSGTNIISATIPVAGATTSLLQGTTLYVAGTQPGVGGVLSVLSFASGAANVNCSSQPATNCQAFPITDGYHTQMQISGNGQLFVGSRACSAGCLTIFNTAKSAVVLPSQGGDVTGIAPIPNRTVVYVCEGGKLYVYDTTTDQLKVFPPQIGSPVIQGRAIDVKMVDF